MRGRILLVQYGGDPLYHQRLCLARLASSSDRVVVLTPDLDQYIEDYQRGPDISAVLWANVDGTNPAGFPRGARVYRFAAWPSGADLRVRYEQARDMARVEDERAGYIPPGVAAAGAVAGGGGLGGRAEVAVPALVPPPAAGVQPPPAVGAVVEAPGWRDPGGPGPAPPPGAPVLAEGERLRGREDGPLLVAPAANRAAEGRWVASATLTLGSGAKIKRGDAVVLPGDAHVNGRWALVGAGADCYPCY